MTFLVFVRVEYAEGNSENWMAPLIVLPFDPDLAQFVREPSSTFPGALVANLRLPEETGVPNLMLIVAASEGAGRLMLEAIASGASSKTGNGVIVARKMPGAVVDLGTHLVDRNR